MFIIICEDILLIYKFDILCRCIIIEYVDRIYFRDIKRCVYWWDIFMSCSKYWSLIIVIWMILIYWCYYGIYVLV